MFVEPFDEKGIISLGIMQADRVATSVGAGGGTMLAVLAAVIVAVCAGFLYWSRASQNRPPTSNELAASAAQGPNSQEPPNMNRNAASNVIAAIAAIAAVAAVQTASPATAAPGGKDESPTSTAAAPRPMDRYRVPFGTGPILGPADAKVTMLVLMDYQCRFCARFFATTQVLLAKHSKELRYQVVHTPLAFHKDAPLAARAVFAADTQGKYWDMHARLLADITKIGRDNLVAHAKALDMNIAKFEADLDSAIVKQRFESDQEAVRSLNITGTPTTFVNGRKLSGAQPMVAVTALIEQELSHANEVLARGIKPSALGNEIVKDAPALALDPPKSTSVPADLPTRPTDPAMIEKIRRCFKNAEEMKLLEGARVYADNVIFKEQINPRLIELGTCVQRALGGRSLRFKAAEIAGAR